MKCMSTISLKSRAAGFSIPTALFVIVILAALGAFLVTIGGSQQAGLAQDVTGTRVLHAARSGLDWGVHESLLPGSTFRGTCAAGGATRTINGLDGMPGITVVVTCSSAAYSEGVNTPRSYQLAATACNNAACPNTVSPSVQYVERRLTALVVN